MNKKILQLALPSIVSNITVPLLGLSMCDCRTFGGRFLYRGDCGRGDAVQYYLLVVRFLADGNEWDDFTGSGETGSPGSNEGFVPVGRCRDSDFSGSASAPVSDTGNSFLTIGYDG